MRLSATLKDQDFGIRIRILEWVNHIGKLISKDFQEYALSNVLENYEFNKEVDLMFYIQDFCQYKDMWGLKYSFVQLGKYIEFA